MLKKVLTLMGLLWAGWAAAQQSETVDSLAPFRPLAAVARLYLGPSVQLDLHLRREAMPVTSASDTLEADMELYYGQPNEYVKSEGLEVIANDSIVLLVNAPARRMTRFLNTPEMKKKMNTRAVPWLPDSSLSALAKRYRGTVTLLGLDSAKTELISKEVIAGTVIPKEKVTLLYRTATGLPVTCIETRASLVPVDSAVFSQLQQQDALKGRLLAGSGKKGRMYLLVKELSTVCSFRKIELDAKRPPVSEQDRLVLDREKGYKPVKGYEDYLLTEN